MNRKRIFALAFAVLMVLALARGMRTMTRGRHERQRLRHDWRAEKRRGGTRPAQGAAGAGERDPVGKHRAVGKGFHGGRQGHDHAGGRENYGDFLLDTVEAAKEQFTDKEYEWLKESATEISNIENRLTELEEKYPEIMQKSMDGDMSMPAGSDTSNPPDDGSMQKFPAFEGKDLGAQHGERATSCSPPTPSPW